MALDPPACNDLPYANGGDAPDCSDPTDGGESTCTDCICGCHVYCKKWCKVLIKT